MNPILINPKIESDKSIPEQLQQMKSYLFQFKEQIELLLMNIDSDNMSEKYKQEISRQFADSKSVSEILQTAGMIKMSVKDVQGNLASLTLTVDQISSEVYDNQGHSRIAQNANSISAEVTRATTAENALSGRITVEADRITSEVTRATAAEGTLDGKITVEAGRITSEVTRAQGAESALSSRITQTESDISAEIRNRENAVAAVSLHVDNVEASLSSYVELGENYSGVVISSNGIRVNSTGALQISSGNFRLDEHGNMTASNGSFSGTVDAMGGSIGALDIGYNGLMLNGRNAVTSGVGGLFIGDDDEVSKTWIWGNEVRLQTAGGYLFLGSNGNVSIDGSFSCAGLSLNNRSAGWEYITYMDGDGVTRTKWFLTG